MQVVILCGGFGTRIRDVSEDVPKPMIPVGDKPVLWHVMKSYAQHGFTDFVLCLGYKGWAIKEWFLNYHVMTSDFTFRLGQPETLKIAARKDQEDWRITFAETGLNAMTGCRVKRIERYVHSDTFMLTYGDGLSDVDLSGLRAFHAKHGRLATVTAVRSPGRFGEIEIADRRVASFQEKPPHAQGWINGGFFVLNREVFARLSEDESLIFEQGPLNDLVRDGELMAHQHSGFWHPMDNSRDYQYLNSLWRTGQAPWANWLEQPERAAA